MRSSLMLLMSVALVYGQPSFTASDIATSADGAQGVFVADMDGDGDMDIVSASDNDDAISWYENNGAADPSWTAADIATNADGAYGVFVADMDNDGDLDIVAASTNDDAISWYENDGAANPSFSAADIATNADGAASVFVADIDSDGDLDIVSASANDDAIAWYENDGAANPSWSSSDIATSADGAKSVFVADMDGDGDLDVVSAAYGDDTIAWYENDGGSDPSWTARDIASSADAGFGIFAADMDGDGDMDIVSASGNDDAIAWYENDGDANPSWTAADIATTADGARSVYVADIDRDGDLDIVAASYEDDAISLYLNNGNTDPSWSASDVATSADGAHSVFVADMDNDGDMDIVSASSEDDAIAWYENTTAAPGTPSFSAADVATSADGAQSVFAADMDSDGDMDIVSASYNDDAIAWYDNNGNSDPSWSASDIATSADGATSIYAADVDGDGDMDLLSSSFSDDKIVWYENNGSQSFTAHSISTSADEAFSVYAIDLDRDGDMDVLSASSDDHKIAWYENNGSESFTAHNITTSANYARDVYAVDVDGDGDVDVLSASTGDDKIAWYENNGSQSFTAHSISTSADGAKSVYAIDLDKDGDIDILSASYNDDKVAWYENNGSQSFTAHSISTSADGANSVYAIDLDDDGDIDVLSSSWNDDKIAWYENNGSQSFTAHTVTTSADYAESVYAKDLDGDGDLDILSASKNDDKIAWYEASIDNTAPTVLRVLSTNGNVNLVNVVFNSTLAGETKLEFKAETELVDPVDNPIAINGLGVGVVNAQ